MTDDAIMDRVWNHPDLPVKLTAPDSQYPWGPEVPWPRRRIDGPSGRPLSFLSLCPCRDGSIVALDPDDMPMVLRRPTVELTGQRWALFGPEDQPARDVVVYLGQCGDCGTIYWAIMR